MLRSIEGNFDHPEVNELLKKHFIELRAASPKGSAHVLDIPGLKITSIKFNYFRMIIMCGAFTLASAPLVDNIPWDILTLFKGR